MQGEILLRGGSDAAAGVYLDVAGTSAAVAAAASTATVRGIHLLRRA